MSSNWALNLCGTDTITKLPWLSHTTRRRSDSLVDGAAVAWRRADAIDANLKFRKPQKQTLSQHLHAETPSAENTSSLERVSTTLSSDSLLTTANLRLSPVRSSNLTAASPAWHNHDDAIVTNTPRHAPRHTSTGPAGRCTAPGS